MGDGDKCLAAQGAAIALGTPEGPRLCVDLPSLASCEETTSEGSMGGISSSLSSKMWDIS